MKIKVVLSRGVLDKLWALGASGEVVMLPTGDEGILDLSEEVVSRVFDLFDEPTFEEALERLIDARLFPSDDRSKED